MIVEGEREGPIELRKSGFSPGGWGRAERQERKEKERCTAAKSLIADIAIVNPAVRGNKIDK
jgi:hypothetical protein